MSTLSSGVTPVTATFAATVASTVTPTGSVTFYDGATSLGTKLLSNGTATLSLPLSVGTHIITASYAGTANFAVSQSAPTTAPAATITGPPSGFIQAANTPIPLSATFTDPNTSNPSAQWSFDSTIAVNGSVSGSTVSGSAPIGSAGVYTVTLTFNDGRGGIAIVNTIGDLPATVIVYDANAGFITGGGWIDSPAGAFYQNASLIGKATFGFVSKYQKGNNAPTGETEFQFQVAKFSFHSTTYDWLVVSGAKAQYKGSGTINGAGNYSFMLTAIDGSLRGSGASDTFRIKIWDPSNATTPIYDNLLNAPDGADPSTTLGGGSVVIHAK
jgi:hypothetical protein